MAHPLTDASATAPRSHTRIAHVEAPGPTLTTRRVARGGIWRYVWPLLAVGLVHLLAVNAIALRWAPEEVNYRHLRVVSQYPRMITPGDSWAVMEFALEQLRNSDPTPVYSAVFFRDRRKFQYPLTSLLPLPLVRELVPERFGLRVPLNILSILALGASALLLPSIVMLGLRDAGVSPVARSTFTDGHGGLTRVGYATLATFTLLLAVTFYPVIFSISLGQIQAWLNALFVGVLWCWLTGRKSWAGVLTALICLVKPHLGLLFLWGMLRREWAFVRAGLTVGTIGLAAAIAAWGLKDNLDYLPVMSFFGRVGEVYLPNQSPNGFLNRLVHEMDPNVWDKHGFAPFHPVVFAGTVASTIALCIGALAWPWIARLRRGSTRAAGWAHGGAGSALDLCIVAVSVTIASPIAWQHHYGVLLPVLVYALALGARWRPLGRATIPALGAAYVLVANDFMDVAGCQVGLLGVLAQSYLLWGALLLLAVLYVYAVRADSAPPGARSRVPHPPTAVA
ncbi:MAG: glycosyltransferase family 87 protein [Gemmatirosa sp.]